MRFRDKVKKPRRPVVVYEILSPREQDGTLSSYAERISSLLSQTHIDAINIPEVHDEEGRGSRPVQNQLRAEPREFGRLLQDNVGVEAIGNRVVVHEKMAAQQRRVIVIDPGHGGKDPGAIAVTGDEEADIVLSASLKLKSLIEQDVRYIVKLTRETDVYVEHEDRVSMARDWGADLFISMHADAAGKPTVRGASVYTISTRGEARIDRTAKRFGWDMPFEDGTPEEVSNILQDLTVRETKSNSEIFAEFLVPELKQAGPLLRNTHRRQNFFVLLAPDVPAVLVEIGFLTNRDDARRLKSERGRRKSAEAIKRAIDAYFDRQDLLFASN